MRNSALRLIEANATATRQLTKHFGLGAGFTNFNLDFQTQRVRTGAERGQEFFGPAVFGYTTF